MQPARRAGVSCVARGPSSCRQCSSLRMKVCRFAGRVISVEVHWRSLPADSSMQCQTGASPAQAPSPPSTAGQAPFRLYDEEPERGLTVSWQ